MASKIVQGKGEVISFYDEDEGAWKPIGCETSHDLDETQDVDEGDVNKCDSSAPKELGAYTYTLDIDAQLLDEDDDDYDDKSNYEWLRDEWKDKREDNESFYWRESGENGDVYGEGYMTELSKSADADGVATFSTTLEGIGEIEDDDPTEDKG